ncbi:Lacal_2735 family protein [Aequorivita aurantiaca]|uniref:Lacal_2735 family protein n=1 Tax=Aequorivita aurantiaca TaxID=3053356 RepID=UPI00338F20AF
MMHWFRKKSRIEKLKERYTFLMRRSFEIALRDTEQSDKIHNQADKLYQEIKYLTLRRGDK